MYNETRIKTAIDHVDGGANNLGALRPRSAAVDKVS